MVGGGNSSFQIGRKPLPAYRSLQQHGPVEEVSERYDSRETLILHDPMNTVQSFTQASKHYEIYHEVPVSTPITEHERGAINTHIVPAGTFPRRHGRRPILWVRPSTLTAFCLVLLLTLAAIVFAAVESHMRNGFTIPEQFRSRAYLWRYGPTAVLTVVIALWRQVDLYTRSNQAWLEMSSAAAPAEKTLLLDYKSPLLPVALWKSLRNKHWRVTTAIAVLASLKVIVAFSTGLFLINETPARMNNVHIMLQKPVTTNNVSVGYYANEVYGNIANKLALPVGVTVDAAFQPLATANKFPYNAIVTAETNAAFPSMECEEATVTVNFTTTKIVTNPSHPVFHNSTTMRAYFNSKFCHSDFGVDYPCGNAGVSPCTAGTYYLGVAQSMDCYTFESSPNNKGQANAFVYLMLAMSPSTSPGGLAVKWSSAAVCQPKYSIQRIDLVQKSQFIGSNEGLQLSAPKTATKDLLPNFAPSNLTQAVNDCLKNFYTQALVTSESSSTVNYDGIDHYFDLMLNDMDTVDAGRFQNVSVMIDSATRIYQRFASHLLASRLNTTDDAGTSGSYTYTEPKLFVQILNVWVVGALLSLAAMSVLCLAVGGVKTSTVRQPDSISQLSSSIRSRSDVATLLGGTGHISDDALQQRMLDFEFDTCPTSQTRNHIQAKLLDNKGTPHLDPDGHCQAATVQHWTPMSARPWFVALCIIVPLIEIAALEVLQRRSDAQNGFADMSLSLHVSQTMTAVIPAVAMLSTTTLCSAVEWAIGVFAPFSLVRNKPVPLKQLDRNCAEGLAPIAMVKAMAKKQFAVSVVIMSTLLGSFLTIVASGLFSINPVTTQHDVTVSTTTQFNTSWWQSRNDRVGNLVSLIQLHNASYPAGTYDNLAFPLMRLGKPGDESPGSSNATTFIDVDVAVLTARLNCSVVAKTDISYAVEVLSNAQFKNVTAAFARLNVTTKLPAKCQRSSGYYQNSSQLTAGFDVEMPDFSSGGFGVAQVSMTSASGPGVLVSNNYRWPEYCPSIAFLAGTFDNNTNVQDKTVLLCTQLQEEIPATLRFNLPSFSLDTRTAPRLDRSRSKTVSGYQYRFDTLFGSGVEAGSGFDVPGERPSTSRKFDFFNEAVLNWTNTPVSSIVGPSNEAFFYNLTETWYGKFMAQYFGAAARVDDPNTTTIDWSWPTLPLRAQLHGSLADEQAMRVFQNSGPKIVLQALLAAMIVCVVAAFAMVDIKGTLPHNTVPIAGTLSLLVGSHLAEECANISELCDDDEEPGRRLRNRHVMLGWWRTKDNPLPRFGLEFVDAGAYGESERHASLEKIELMQFNRDR